MDKGITCVVHMCIGKTELISLMCTCAEELTVPKTIELQVYAYIASSASFLSFCKPSVWTQPACTQHVNSPISLGNPLGLGRNPYSPDFPLFSAFSDFFHFSTTAASVPPQIPRLRQHVNK